MIIRLNIAYDTIVLYMFTIYIPILVFSKLLYYNQFGIMHFFTDCSVLMELYQFTVTIKLFYVTKFAAI